MSARFRNPELDKPAYGLWTLSANPQSRYQVTNVFANQTEATYKFGLEGWQAHRAGRRRNLE